ncbi:flagellar biosynthesis protein [Luteibacter sp. Sphag1AF]|uniref:flagellar biosynthesis protein n=1 Tax=Luteibacter sp. Sphag1AF TaxID=2587031 RepID=UPI001612C128|nr:flagellar biosynthesis protein [Luteibacter sp. Sphag1AF]MBB3225720.1 flagellar biosynthesis protein [Luteibacter sp. Sphag1AF]
MTLSLPSPRRSVTLRVASPTHNGHSEHLDAAAVKAMMDRAQAMGLSSPHLDPQVATLLAAVRLRDDVPPELYAALAALMGTLLSAAKKAE